MENSKIPILFCVDVEPDPRLLEKGQENAWQGFEAMHDYLAALRPRLAEATGSPAHFSWFLRMDPQIEQAFGTAEWAADRYESWFREYKEKGDELGLHPHAYRWEENLKTWITDHGNQEWVEHCVGMAYDAFLRRFGTPCESFRFGDMWMNHDTALFLEKLGIRYDLTLEPGYPARPKMVPSEKATGSLPDTREVPSHPYRFSARDYRVPDAQKKDGLWVIPMSAGTLRFKLGRFEKIWKGLAGSEDVKPKPLTLNLAFGVNNFAEVRDRLLSSLERPFLAMVARTDTASRADLRRNMEAHFEGLMKHPLRERFVFTTPAEALALMGYEKGRKIRPVWTAALSRLESEAVLS